MASYQTFPKAETNELPAKKHSQASTIAVMVAALCLGAAYVSTTTGPAWAEEFFTGGGDDGYNPDDHVLCPGVKPGTNQYCDCSSDCRESNRNKYCFCAEARAEACCGIDRRMAWVRARTVGSVSSLVTSARARASGATSGTTICATS